MKILIVHLSLFLKIFNLRTPIKYLKLQNPTSFLISILLFNNHINVSFRQIKPDNLQNFEENLNNKNSIVAVRDQSWK